MNRIFFVLDYWDKIITGVCSYNDKKYFFDCIFSEDDDNYTDIYQLIELDEQTFNRAQEEQNYWSLNGHNKENVIPFYQLLEDKITIKLHGEMIKGSNKDENFVIWKEII